MTLHWVDSADRRPAHELTLVERDKLQRTWRQRMRSVLLALPLYVVVDVLVDRFAVHHEAGRSTGHPPTWLVVVLVVGAVALVAGTVWWSRWPVPVVLGSIGAALLLVAGVAAWTRRGSALVVLAVFAVGGVALCLWVAVSTRRSLAWAAEQELRPRRTR